MSIANILEYWFENGKHTTKSEMNRWFIKSTNYDDEIIEKYKSLHTQIINNEKKHWSKSFDGILALIIVLDQFSRQIYRNNKNAFKYDSIALELTLEALKSDKIKIYINQGRLKYLLFLTLPLQHSEKMEYQEMFYNFWTDIKDNIESKIPHDSEKYKLLNKFVNQILYHSKRHLNLIKQFGRFPKRNEALNRKSTKEEIEYLQKNKYGHY